MFNRFLSSLFREPQYVWRNNDHDIPVKLIKVAGISNGVPYAEVEFEGRVSYVPLKELVRVQ